MADNFYLGMQAVASSLIGEFAQGDIRYIVITPGTGPADDPGPATQTVVPINATARTVQFKYIDHTNVLTTDLQITLPGDIVPTPEINGFFTVDGVHYKIIRIIRKPAAGTPVAFDVIVRK